MTTPLDTYEYRPPEDAGRGVRPDAPAEWLLIVGIDEADRVLLVRRSEDEPPTLPSTVRPHPLEGFEAGIASVLSGAAGVTLAGTPCESGETHPVHVRHPYTGAGSTGLVRAVAVRVHGEPLAGLRYHEALTLKPHEARTALSTDLERNVLDDGLAAMRLAAGGGEQR